MAMIGQPTEAPEIATVDESLWEGKGLSGADTGLEKVKVLKGDRSKDLRQLKGKSKGQKEEGKTGEDGRCARLLNSQGALGSQKTWSFLKLWTERRAVW